MHLSSTADRSSLFQIAVANKILLYIGEPLHGVLSPNEQATLAAYKFQTFSINSTLLREMVDVAETLKSLQIPFMFMKGPLQQQLIHGDFFSRPVADIDVLLARKNHRRAALALQQSGYQSTSTSLWWRTFLGEEHLVKNDAFPLTVDLHYRVQQPGSPAPRNPHHFLDGVEEIAFLGSRLPTMARRNIPLLSAISIAKGLFNREATAAHVCDLYALLQTDLRSNAAAFLAAAETQGLGGTAVLALRAVSALFGVEVPVLHSDKPVVLDEISDDMLVRMLVTPDDPELAWPMRRQVLWDLCQHHRGQYAKEVARALASEAALRLFEPPSSTDQL